MSLDICYRSQYKPLMVKLSILIVKNNWDKVEHLLLWKILYFTLNLAFSFCTWTKNKRYFYDFHNCMSSVHLAERYNEHFLKVHIQLCNYHLYLQMVEHLALIGCCSYFYFSFSENVKNVFIIIIVSWSPLTVQVEMYLLYIFYGKLFH